MMQAWELHEQAIALAAVLGRAFTKYKAVPYGDKLRAPIRCGWYATN